MLPLLPVLAWVIGGADLLGVLGFELIKWLEKNKGTILLTGQIEAGKDAVLNALLGNKFSQNYEATPTRSEAETSSKNFTYTIINISGNPKFNKEKEKIKSELQNLKQKESDRHIIYIYIFDILKYELNKSQILAEIKNATKEANERSFIPKIIATRGDKMDLNKQKELKNEIRQNGADIEIFDMTRVGKDEIFSFLERT